MTVLHTDVHSDKNFASDKRSGLLDMPVETAGIGSRWNTVGSVRHHHLALVWLIGGDPHV
jgi:hypothetical protein